MAINQSVYLTAFFSTNGTPQTGLTPTIEVYRLDETVPIVTGGVVTEVGAGWYQYTITADADFQGGNDYVWTMDGGAGMAGAERYKHGTWSWTEVDDVSPAGVELIGEM